MRVLDGNLILSATDLSGFFECRHRTGLELAVARGALVRPVLKSPSAEQLRKRGEEHERSYVESLRSKGLSLVILTRADPPERTLAAMRDGVGAIVQANLSAAGWAAYADVLIRVKSPSALGDWSYEALDTKLARDTRGATLLQLSVYSELLRDLQGAQPECFHVVTPDTTYPLHTYRVEDCSAYFRLVRQRLLETLKLGPEEIQARYYPEPVESCDVCPWWERCDRRRRQDDHLSFIADITRLNRRELEEHGIATLEAAASLPLPIAFKPVRGSREVYQRLREQARVQLEQRTERRPVWELLLPLEEARGLCRLPAPSPGDVFLDLEGARFAREGGRDFLFGAWWRGAYSAWWAFDDATERKAFEDAVDFLLRAWEADPGMHVYHFAHYEPTAFKRLMSRHATRIEEVDRLLRAERFVDLHAVTRQALRAGVESYSIKCLEPYYGFTREMDLRGAGVNLQAFHFALESGAVAALAKEVREAVLIYNRDDCRSTEGLRDWLESLRAEVEEVEKGGAALARPEEKALEASEKSQAIHQEAEAVRARLLAGLPAEAADAAHPDHPQWLLAHLVDWHQREAKAQWWELFRFKDMTEEDLLDEPDAVAGLELVERLGFAPGAKGKPTRSVIDRYRYPNQAMEVGQDKDVKLPDGSVFGKVVGRDLEACTIDLRKGPTLAETNPAWVFAADVVGTDDLQKALLRLGDEVARSGAEIESHPRCDLDLLFRRPPRLRTGTFRQGSDGSPAELAVQCVGALDRTTLAIQGPPGAGKTYAGARMILALARAGKRVGVTAVSHKVIRNLLEEVERQAGESRERIRIGHRTGEAGGSVVGLGSNEKALAALESGDVAVLGATAWFWAWEKLGRVVDVLFVDEAGQMSLANALAAARAAESLVLLGDPQQLEQPQKGTHPDGASVSALEHLMNGARTMPAEQGIFMPETWRMAPEVCRFTSEVFYEGRLSSRAGLENQRLVGNGRFEGAGLWCVPVEHEGNQSWSSEEVDAVAKIVERLLAPGSRWIGADLREQQLEGSDLRVVAPCNAQVNRLHERLAGHGVPVGTVDRFQGQTAAVAIYSMATSRPEDAPRGMEFLYSLNRLNVATSRARCAVILVASPRLFEPDCRTPRQMQLANALCRYREMAKLERLEPEPL